MEGQNGSHLILVEIVDVLVDGVAGELHLTQTQVHGGRLRNVHDFAVGSHDKDEAVQCL